MFLYKCMYVYMSVWVLPWIFNLYFSYIRYINKLKSPECVFIRLWSICFYFRDVVISPLHKVIHRFQCEHIRYIR